MWLDGKGVGGGTTSTYTAHSTSINNNTNTHPKVVHPAAHAPKHLPLQNGRVAGQRGRRLRGELPWRLLLLLVGVLGLLLLGVAGGVDGGEVGCVVWVCVCVF